MKNLILLTELGFFFCLIELFFLFPNCNIHPGGMRDWKYNFSYLKIWNKFDLQLFPLLPQLPFPSRAAETVVVWEANLNIPVDITANRHKNTPLFSEFSVALRSVKIHHPQRKDSTSDSFLIFSGTTLNEHLETSGMDDVEPSWELRCMQDFKSWKCPAWPWNTEKGHKYFPAEDPGKFSSTQKDPKNQLRLMGSHWERHYRVKYLHF